jgi:putative phosphoribosyl transferase
VTDDEVVETLRRFRDGRGRRDVSIPVAGGEIHGDLVVPRGAKAVVVCAHGGGRASPRNRLVAEALHRRTIATLLFDLLTEEESATEDHGRLRFDIGLLSERLAAAAAIVGSRDDTSRLPVGFFGAGAGAACALEAAARMGRRVGAIVSRGGRPDLARDALARITAPTLLIVGGEDQAVIGFNQFAYSRLGSRLKRLEIVPGATHLFEEPGALERAAESAARWFEAHLVRHAGAVAAPSASE